MTAEFNGSGDAIARRQWQRRVGTLLSGASALTLAVVLPWPSSVRAEDVRYITANGSRYFLIESVRGENGRNAEVNTFSSNVSSTKGLDGPSFVVRNQGAIVPYNGSAPVLLQSFGGDGGNSDKSLFGWTVLLGSGAGNGGNIRFENNGQIKADRLRGASIISLLSQGGQAGTYGTADNAYAAGNGGNVYFSQTGQEIQAESRFDAKGAAVRLQSLGGNGARGYSVAKTHGSGSEVSTHPGSGGNGGNVTVDIQSNLSVWGGKYVAVHATSRGGDAGYGGTSLFSQDLAKAGQAGNVSIDVGSRATVYTVGAYSPVLLAEALGGNGGDVMKSEDVRGSDGGSLGGTRDNPSVRVTNRGLLSADHTASTGIIAQSIGGVGGGGQAGLGHGNTGGNGGSGGFVVVQQIGTVETRGESAYGIVAQSVGGGGGKGGNDIFIGGNGGRAGNGGGVFVSNTGKVTTAGYKSTAIVALSVGGGNALGAFNAILPSTETGGGGDGGSGGLLFFGKGGAGGAGGTGGAVTVDNSGTIITKGESALGILAQSIGGGGGGGGTPKVGGLLFSAALGGKGGSGTQASDVVVNNLSQNRSGGFIETSGRYSIGILAQSIGGGGGYGGGATSGAVGPQFSLSMAVGGSGGVGGQAGNATVNNGLRITTRGDDATAIYANSVGGGGGSGGEALAVAAAVGIRPDLPTISIAHGVGGDGGTGNTAGEAKVINSAQLQTYGDNSGGIRVRSIGGGGGSGGTASAAGINIPLKSVAAMSITSAVGGNGAQGGTGGLATVENSGSITTGGSFSSAISAYSVGGGGGDAGAAEILAKDFLVREGLQVKLTTSFGGTGGSGNTGGTVIVKNTGELVTTGAGSHAIEAISIGGGGGVGGDTSPLKLPSGMSALDYADMIAGLALKGGPKYNVNLSQTIGGAGGMGAVAGTVTVENSGSLTTMAAAILAQSIGGGGGNAGAASLNQSSNVSLNQAVGGKGGSGGNGNTVTVTTSGNGTIATLGDGAEAIFAQSVGGGGGRGGNATSMSGGSSLTSNQYTATLKGPAKASFLLWFSNNPAATREKVGEFLKSKLNWAVSWLPKNEKLNFLGEKAKKWANEGKKPSVPVSVSINSAVGGQGGAAGDGKTVIVTNAMNLTTSGDAASAIFAQSVGGGGGNGGMSQVGTEKLIDIKQAIGGSGGGGGNSDRVTVSNTGNITTLGQSSFGIVAQSIGAGGGVANTTVDLQSGLLPIPMTTIGASIKQMVGGSAGVGGKGGIVDVTNRGAIDTGIGGEAHGILAQSIGGGGGISVVNLINPNETLRFVNAFEGFEDAQAVLENHGINLAEEKQTALKLIESNKTAIHQYTIALGGEQASGKSDEVLVKLGSTINTGGDGAIGIVAQSIGGGGGLVSAGGGGGESYKNKFSGHLGGVGSTGNGDLVSVTLENNAAIATQGAGALGILAQSIGGGGGYIGSFNSDSSTLGLLLGGSKDNTGSGGDVTIASQNTGDERFTISTKGEKAHGILAQSLGGGGGYMAMATIPTTSTAAARQNVNGESGKAASGTVSITTTGDIYATGADSYGIFAQTGIQKSDGSIDNSRPSGKIAISHNGVISGGSGTGAAVRLDGGIDNQIRFDSKSVVKAASGVAIIGSENRDTLLNNGYLAGDVLLARGKAAADDLFVNYVGGTYVGGKSIDLGSKGQFTNIGKFYVGGAGQIGNTQLTGNLTLDSMSTMLVDVSSMNGTRSDKLTVSGIATLGGRLQVNVLDGLRQETYDVMTAAGGLSGDVKATGPGTWNVINWSANKSGNNLTLTPRADFVVPSGMLFTAAENEIRTGLQDIWNNYGLSDTGARLFAGFAQVGSEEEYRKAIDSLSPEESASSLQQRMEGARQSMNSALSCPVFEGTGTMLRETECAWARIGAAQVEQGQTVDIAGYSKSSGALRVGAQGEIADNWYVGAAAGYTWSRLHDLDGLSVTDGHAFDASVSLKHEWDAWQFGLVGHLGFGNFDTSRMLVFGPTQWNMQGTSQVFTAGTRLRAAYQFTLEDWYVRPYADVDLVYTKSPAHRERGINASMSFDSAESLSVAFSPNVEFGARLNMSEETWLRPYASVGMTAMAGNSTQINGALNLGAGDDSFSFQTKNPKLLFNVGAGIQLYHKDRLELRGEYRASFAPSYVEQEGTLRLSVQF